MKGDKIKPNSWTTVEELEKKINGQKVFGVTIELGKMFKDSEGKDVLHKAIKLKQRKNA